MIKRCDPDWLDCGEIARLVTQTGCAVLVIPPGRYEGEIPPRRVVVGWNGSRGAARALHDAIPLLRVALSVELLIVSAAEVDGEEIALSLRNHLRRHGVLSSARIAKCDPRSGVDHILLDAAQDADLIVMGAFGQSLLRELTLGSVTASVIEAARIPVLLSY